LWRWEGVAIGSTAVYGGIGAMYVDDYIVAAALFFLQE
jgi:hypothetical protein